MAEANDSNRKATDLGSRSPGSKEAQEQTMAGAGGARAGQTAGEPGQPAQASNRRDESQQPEPERRRSFEPGHAPSEQGEKDHPSPHVIAQHQQGIGRQSGNTAGSGDRSEEEAQRGEPDEEHTRNGRQSTGGDRPGHRTE